MVAFHPDALAFTWEYPIDGRFCCLFGRDNEYIIPWECISQIGDDIILVKIDEEKCFHKG